MATYTRKTWQDGDLVTPDTLNNIENGVEKLNNCTIYQDSTDGNFYITSPDGTKTKKLGSSEGSATVAQVLQGATFNSANTSDSEDYSIGTMNDCRDGTDDQGNPRKGVQTIDVTTEYNDGVSYTLTPGYYESIKLNQKATKDASYNSGKTDYNPNKSNTTLGNDGALTVKNAAGTQLMTKTFTNSYNQGYADGWSNKGLAGWVNASGTGQMYSFGYLSTNFDDSGVFNGNGTKLYMQAGSTQNVRVFVTLTGDGSGDGYSMEVAKNGTAVKAWYSAYGMHINEVLTFSMNNNDYLEVRCTGSTATHNFSGTVLAQIY